MRKPSVLFIAAGLLFIAQLLVRFVGIGHRASFMSDFYGSFAEGLKQDVWFSEGWLEYIGTPAGAIFAWLPLALLLGSLFCLFLGIRAKMR